jgi:predicted transcriptional regulator
VLVAARVSITAMTQPGGVVGKMRRDDVAALRVADVMVRRPKTIPADASVADLREHFANPRVRTALLAADGRFQGAISPEELPDAADGSEPALAYARRDVPSVGADATMAEALAEMDSREDHRLIVLGDDGETLIGLLCLDRSGASFCVDGTAQATQPHG